MIVTTRRDARTGRKVGQGGGRWSKWHRDLTIQMRAKPGNDVRFTTLFDSTASRQIFRAWPRQRGSTLRTHVTNDLRRQ